jgi:hypothetical protein
MIWRQLGREAHCSPRRREQRKRFLGRGIQAEGLSGSCVFGGCWVLASQAAADVFQRHDEAVEAMGSVGMHLQCGSGRKGGRGGGGGGGGQ